MARNRRRKPSEPDETTTVIDGNKIVLGMGAVILLIGVGAFAFWFAGRQPAVVASRQPARQPVQRQSIQAQAQPVQPAARPISPSSSQATSAQAAPDITLSTFDGDLRLSEKRGDAVVLFFSFVG